MALAFLRVLSMTSLLLFASKGPAQAFRPFTHNTSAFIAYNDAIDDGSVSVNGTPYVLRPEIVAALTAWPAAYNAGVVGPDGFPDLTYGQSQIHPLLTGEWIQHILSEAWLAQSDGTYTAAEKEQILAFSYGFATHAAGDMWAHTIVNDFANGVFPSITEVVQNEDDASIALSHFITEGYIADTTPNFDTNPDRTVLPDGDTSDDSTPGVDFMVPKVFVYRALVDPAASTPFPGRGPLIEFFLDLRADLVTERDSLAGDLSQVTALGDLISSFQSDELVVSALESQLAAVQAAAASVQVDCSFTTLQCTDLSLVCLSVAGFNFGCLDDLFSVPTLCEGETCLDMTSGPCSVDLGFPIGTVQCTDVPGIPDQLCADFAPESIEVGPTNPVQCASDLASVLVATGQTFDVPTTLAEFNQLVSDLSVVASDLSVAVALAQAALELDRELILKAYLDFWIDDIDQGLVEWPEGVGLALTRGLFDPQARRDYQDAECTTSCDPENGGLGEGSMICASCEGAISATSTALHELDPFISSDIKKMLGAPDVLVDLQNILSAFAGDLGLLLAQQTAVPLNPLLETQAAVQDWWRAQFLLAIREVLGVDIAQLDGFMKNSPGFICLDEGTFDFPPPLGNDVTIQLFASGEHDRLDTILDQPLPQLMHHEPAVNLPDGCGPLFDHAEFVYTGPEPVDNTITFAKLLLMDGAGLDQLLSDLLGRTIDTYTDGVSVPANIMVQGLFDVSVDVGTGPLLVDSWLRNIDGDHAWRADGMPRFCDLEDASCCADPGDPFCSDDQDPACEFLDGPCPRIEILNAGNGSFPIWESCVLRPAFRDLFEDWENGGLAFPDLVDLPSPDPANDPAAPTSSLVLSGPSFDNGSLVFVGPGHGLTLTATDAPASKAFADLELGLQRRATLFGEPQGAFLDVGQGDVFGLAGADGSYLVEYRSEDPCHRFDGSVGTSEAIQSDTYGLDTTPASVQCGAFAGAPFQTDGSSLVELTVDDAPGAGLATVDVSIDGYVTAAGTVASSSGGAIDMFLFHPGERTVEVSHLDNVGNAGVDGCTFFVVPSSASILANIGRADTEGLITDGALTAQLQAVAQAAANAGSAGDSSAERDRLTDLIALLGQHAGGAIDADTAERLEAYANDRLLQIAAAVPAMSAAGQALTLIAVLCLGLWLLGSMRMRAERAD